MTGSPTWPLKSLIVSLCFAFLWGCPSGPKGGGDAGPQADAGQTDGSVPVFTSGLSANGYGANPIVRQGAGLVSMTVSGQSLAGVTSVTVAPPLTALITGASATQVTFNLTVPHGAPPGLQTVTLNGAQSLTAAGAITITPITAATTGSDTNTGSAASPFRTVTHALAMAGSGDTVSLADGTYSDGEHWPIETTALVPVVAPNVMDGVTVQGTSVGGTILSGPADAGLDAGFGLAALVLQGSASVERLTVQGFERGILDLSGFGALALQDVHVGPIANDGVVATGTGTVSANGDCRIHDCGFSAMALLDSAQLTANGLVVDHNVATGLYFATDAGGSVSNCELGFNGAINRRDWDVYANGYGVNVSLTHCHFHDTAGGVLLAFGSQVSIENSLLENTTMTPRALDAGSRAWGVGVYTGYTARVALINTTIRNTDNTQVLAYDSNVRLYQVTLADGGNFGIQGAQGDGGPSGLIDVSYSNVFNHVGDGINLDYPTSVGTAVIDHVTSSGNDSNVSSYGGTMTIQDSILTNSRTEGIYSQALSNITVVNTQISDAGDNGILLWNSSNALIEGSTITARHGSSVLAHNSSNVHVSGSTLTGEFAISLQDQSSGTATTTTMTALSAFCFLDQRIASAGTVASIAQSTCHGAPFPTGTFAGPGDVDSPYLLIVNGGDSIEIY